MVFRVLNGLCNNRVNLYLVGANRLKRAGKHPLEFIAFVSKKAWEIICVDAALANFTAKESQDGMPAEREQSRSSSSTQACLAPNGLGD